MKNKLEYNMLCTNVEIGYSDLSPVPVSYRSRLEHILGEVEIYEELEIGKTYRVQIEEIE